MAEIDRLVAEADYLRTQVFGQEATGETALLLARIDWFLLEAGNVLREISNKEEPGWYCGICDRWHISNTECKENG